MKNLVLLFFFYLSASTATAQTAIGHLLKPSLGTEAKKPSIADSSTALPLGTSSGEKIVTPPTAHDDLRNQKVLNSLAQQAGWFPNVKITVVEGMVSINGTAKNAEQVEWLAKTADRLPGVIAVINHTELETTAVTDFSPVWTEFRHILEEAKKAIPLVLLALLVLVIFFILGKYFSQIVQNLWGRHIANPFLLTTVSRLTMFPIWAIFFYLTLKTAGLSGLATAIIGGTGAASLVIGFAFKGIAENYLSGLLLAIRSPFTKGDEIQIDKYSGFVQSLNMRGTTIIDYDGNVVLIPNSMVIQSVVRNRTTNPSTRTSFVITISYHDSVARAQDLIYQGISKFPDILTKPSPSVYVDKLSPAGIDLLVLFWYDISKSSGDRLKSLIAGQIKDQLLAGGFHIPDTAREIIFTDTLKVRMFETGEAAEASDNKRQASIQEKATAQLNEKPAIERSSKNFQTDDVRDLAEDVNIMKKSVHSDLLKPH